MERVELKISTTDWFYIITIGVMFGLLLSLLIYFLSPTLQAPSTLVFSTITGLFIALFSSLFISISNNLILPKINRRFWYSISFFFSFISGAFGFLFSFMLFSFFHTPITAYLAPDILVIAVIIGCLTFLVGLMLHHFIAMKYRHESIKSSMLEARLKSLETELNPHFLFNALNSISELIHIDQNAADKALLNLSKLLRNAIEYKSLVMLEEELVMVENYLALENIRFDGKIIFSKTIDANVKEWQVPKFSIQLLVENAIKHGFESKTLHIDVVAEPGMITVCNDGKTIDHLQYGIGLQNLKRRLSILDVGYLRFIPKEVTCFQIVWKEKRV